MKKCFCDKCGKELDYEKMNYVVLMMNDYGDHDSPGEGWDLCHDCAKHVKDKIVHDLLDKTMP